MSGFKQGELIFSSAPYAYILDDAFRGKLCDYCFLSKSDLKRCSQCTHLYFCNKSCQTEAWKLHKMECKFLKKAGISKPGEWTRLYALILLKLKKSGMEEPYDEVGGRRISFASLHPHSEELKQDARNTRIMMTRMRLLCQYIGFQNMPSAIEFSEVYGKVCTSLYDITPEVTTVVGMGLYLGATVFQHSCAPEAAIVYDGPTLNIRMRKSIPHRKLDRVHVSLIPDIRLREERKKYLWENRYFCCSCSLCTSPNIENLMTKLLNSSQETKEKAKKCTKDLQDLLQIRSQMDDQSLYDKCMNLLKMQSEVFARTNIHKVRTLLLALSVSSQLEKWDDARILAASLEEPYRLYRGENHPHLASFLFSFGKILHFVGHEKEAMEKLCESERIFEVTHGKEHPMLDEVDSFLQCVMCKFYRSKNVMTGRNFTKHFLK